MKKALIFKGGWQGHEPNEQTVRWTRLLGENGFEVEVYDDQECLADLDKLKALDLIIPQWTMGPIDRQYSKNVALAVGSGVGLAGNHGGMCDAFRQDTEWQFMTGGQWVSHPGGDGIEYTVNIADKSSEITAGIDDFKFVSEHYYMHIDPAIDVLATTRFPSVSYYHVSNKPVDMPVAWTKMWGNGRVFYTSLGHHDDVFDKFPQAQTLMLRGMLWAAAGKQYALDNGLTTERFENKAKMY